MADINPKQLEFVETEQYKDLVERHKHKLTTDDCYTPPEVYDAVLDWCVEKYGVDPEKVLRPFYPGGDYEREEYPEGSVVVDNPPFSILSKIVRFYESRNVRFFLFAPYLTALSGRYDAVRVITAADITYENGATIAAAFVTNLEPADIYAIAEPELAQRLKKADKQAQQGKKQKPPVYKYPDNVLTAAMLGYLANHGVRHVVHKRDGLFISALDAQKAVNKGIYGYGYLLSNSAAAEKVAAEKAAAEKAAAEKISTEKVHVWALSERELEMIRQLDG